jgi:hypothetical protein
MTLVDGLHSRELDEAFAQFLIESGCMPATAVKSAWQARWRGSHWLGAIALSSGMLNVREASAVLQLHAATNETFGACAHHLGILTLQQIAELSLIGYWQRRTFSDCLVEDQGACLRGIAELRRLMDRAVDSLREVRTTPRESALVAC